MAEKVTKKVVKKAVKVDKKDKKKKSKKPTSSDDDSDADSDLGSDAAAEGSDAEPNGSMRQTNTDGAWESSRAACTQEGAHCIAAAMAAPILPYCPSLFDSRAAVRICARVDCCQRWTLL